MKVCGMHKYILSIALCLSACFQAHAEGSDLVTELMGDTPVQETNVKKQSETDKNKDGFLSFLDFSFIKKPFSLFGSENKQEAAATNEGEDKKVETPFEKAVRMAESGDAESALALGYMYLYGQSGVETDYQKAFHFYELAAKQNNLIALNNLGSLYFNGIGTEVDYDKAIALFKKAAELGSDDAAVNLAFIYLSSRDKVYFTPAIALFEQAADTGNNTAKFMLGYAYYKGFVVPQDLRSAVQLIQEAANANFDEAQLVFARMYIYGQGIAQNYGHAITYYRRAIAQGNIEAIMDLAKILTEGQVYAPNLLQAHTLYNIASVYGVEGAAESRDSLKSSLKLEQLLEAQNAAEKYQPHPSELTQYIRHTFGTNIRKYIDDNLSKQGKKS